MPSVQSQPVDTDLTRAAIFLVATLGTAPDHAGRVRALCGKLAALVRSVGFRDLNGQLTCVIGFGSAA